MENQSPRLGYRERYPAWTGQMRFTIGALIILTFVTAVAVFLYTCPVALPVPTSPEDGFVNAATTLCKTGDRVLAARMFENVAAHYPDSEFADKCIELAVLLRQMIVEDNVWKEPQNPDLLTGAKLIEYHVYHLRNAKCHQLSQPGSCWLLDRGNQTLPSSF